MHQLAPVPARQAELTLVLGNIPRWFTCAQKDTQPGGKR